MIPMLGKRSAVHIAEVPRMRAMAMMAHRPPEVLDRSHINPNAQLLSNDVIGDCTAAGLLNAAAAQCSLSGYRIGITDNDAIAFYTASTGYDPTNPSSDVGGVEIDVLGYAARHGLRTRDQVLYPSYGTIDHDDLNGARVCMSHFGTVYAGFQLAMADQVPSQEPYAVWDTDGVGDNTPGSWGGHCALLWDYTGWGATDTVGIITWGRVQRATWRWVQSRCDELHGIGFHQLASAGDRGPSMSDWSDLVRGTTLYHAR